MKKRSLSALLLGAFLAAPGLAQDFNVSRVASNNDWNYYGQSNGIAAYSLASTSCNVGNQVVIWNDNINQAPVIAQNLFRITPEGQFYQLGYSWLKDGFCAINENTCGSCQSTNCDTLGIGCADTYGAFLNDGANGVAKWQINATVGAWPNNWVGPTGPLPLRGRLQVPVAEVGDDNSTYIAEIQYVSEEDHAAGNARNNQSWRRVQFAGAGINNPSNVGATQINDPAIFAWKVDYPDVNLQELVVTDEGGPGVHGYIFIGSKATDIGGGLFRYDYVVHNLNSDRSIGSFGLTVPGSISDVTARHVDHHSGSPWGNDDWTFTNTSGALLWATETEAQNANANAIRWGMANTYSFVSSGIPTTGIADVGLFKAGSPAALTSEVIIPGNDGCSGGGFTDYCSANANSASAGGAILTANGTPDVAANDLSFVASNLPTNQPGYFLMSESQAFVPLFSGSQGNLCVGAPIVRFNQNVLNSGSFGIMQFAVDNTNLPQGTVFQPGDSWNFQLWFRDVNPGTTSNTTAGINVEFCQ